LFGNKSDPNQRYRTLDNLTPTMGYKIIYKLWSNGFINAWEICHLIKIGKVTLNNLEKRDILEWLPEAEPVLS
jgi:hypothetical protein